MQRLIFATGALLIAIGFGAFQMSKDPSLLQGGLTLGGGFIICGIFSMKAKWHGIIGAGVLALLGAARTIPSLITQQDSTMAFRATAGVICLILLVAVVKCLKAERDRRSIEQLKADGE
jgi:hypothetical protein